MLFVFCHAIRLDAVQECESVFGLWFFSPLQHRLDAIPGCVSASVFCHAIRLDAVQECESVFGLRFLCPLQHRLDAIPRI